MHRDKEEIKGRLDGLFKDLMEIALEDSVLSGDEQEILSSIRQDLDSLNKQLMQILEDDLDEEEFHDICTQILEDIIINAQTVAEKDKIVTYEEKKLLDRLSEFVASEELFK